jgi:formate hydrogenlyase transcriptional activator
MVSAADGSSPPSPGLDVRLVIDAIPALAWSSHPDGAVEFVNRKWHDYTGLSPEASYGWGWKAAVHSEDLPALLANWGGSPDLENPRERNVRLRRSDGVFHWFLLRREPLHDETGAVVRWYGTGIDVEEGRQKELLRVAEKRTLELIADGASLSEVLNDLCAAIDVHTSATSLVFLMDRGGQQLLPIAGPHLPPAVTAAFTPWPIGPNMGSCGTAAFTKERVIISDISKDPLWPRDNRGQAARQLVLDHGLCASWSEPLISNSGEVVGTFCIAYSQPRTPNGRDLGLIEAAGHIARIAIERQRSQEALRTALETIKASETKLRQVIDAIPTLAWCNLPDGPNEFLNKRWHQYTGLSHEQSNGWGWQVAFHPEDLPPLMEKWRVLLLSAQPGEIEARLRRHDGVYRWFLIRVEPLRDDRGQLVRWYGTSTDIDALKQAQEKLREEEQELRRITDAIPQTIVVLDPTGAPIYVNQATLDYTGMTAKDVVAPNFRERIFHPDDLESLRDERKAALARGLPFEVEQRALRKDGQYRWFLIRYNPLLDERGNVIRWYATGTDIEHRKRAENKLRQEERELRQLIDFLPQHVLVLDKYGALLQANKTMLDYKGCTLEEMKGVGTRERINRDVHPDDLDRIQNERSAALSRGTPFEMEKRLLDKDGHFRWFLFRYNPVLTESGDIVRWFATATDIEDRKQAEVRMRNEAVALREQIDRDSMFEDIVGSSEALRKVIRQVAKVASSDSTVLILGETGTGKELIARAIHKRSKRADRAFIGVNCAAVPPSLIASELFGHEKGAFTGATQRRLGRFESANSGTIFLDEIGDLPGEVQISLLRVLQEREIERVGGNNSVHVDVRVLAATHRDLNALVAEGHFREDLLYRLNVVPIEVPPLRERVADIPLLVEYFIDRFSKRAGKKFRTIDKRSLRVFQAYLWPGNVRELQNVVERAVILSEGETFAVDEAWLSRELRAGPKRVGTLTDRLLKQEKEMIEAALAASNGRISGSSGAAIKLGLPSRTLDSKIKRLKINLYRFKAPR